MKLRNLRLDNQPQLMIIPMIDIIFFLLVFFMMSTLSMVEQRTIPVNLPQAAASLQDMQHNTAITVMQDGNVMFDQETIPLTLLGKRAKTALLQQPENVFVLRADKQTEYEKVVAALDELKAAGARRISIATERKVR
ncbi:biopolymer transporter ExbD [Pelosinus sp. IPA-1]|uniref:ExbD/TolR family protein n=1 Tax=Pelosinus sp. IPA-1 TaxID=3029569 RepID=UPI00243619DC|nr:biopolymer transporter ExbD [Pelosinus sp. IPA-1]GMA98878.1 biopolymer transporter protein ExbD [Pelosinus sp. IPA-1]